MKKNRFRKLAVGVALTTALSGAAVALGDQPSFASTCRPYSGYVLHKDSPYIYVWNPNTGCESWIYASQAWTCNQYEWFNGFTCPLPGGGGGGNSW